MSEGERKPSRFTAWTVVSWGSVLLGAMSLTSLSMKAFHLGFAAAFTEVFGFYEVLLRETLGHLEPPLNYVLHLLPWRLPKLDPLWREAFVLLSVLFGPMVRSAIRDRFLPLAVAYVLFWIAFTLMFGLWPPITIAKEPGYVIQMVAITLATVAAFLLIGALLTWIDTRKSGKKFGASFRDDGMAQVGVSGAKAVVGAGILLLLNAGLGDLGL